LAHLHQTAAGLHQPFDWSGFRKEEQQTTLEKVTQETDTEKEQKVN
jgi:hypothetical protein